MLEKEEMILCGANSYEKKYYLNQQFNNLPEQVKQELQVMCVLFTEEIGGIFVLEYSENGKLVLKTQVEENDFLFDEIGAELKIKQLREEKKELFESLEAYYIVWRKQNAFSN
jgi:hypothetical protein